MKMIPDGMLHQRHPNGAIRQYMLLERLGWRSVGCLGRDDLKPIIRALSFAAG